jgi:Ca2+/H+ antiporter
MAIEYNMRKTIAKGMLDIALLLSNASRMKSLLKRNCLDSVKCTIGVISLCISIILQVAVGIMLIILGRREQLSINNAKLVEKNSKEENLQKTDETNDDEDKKKKVPNESMSLAEEADCLKKDQSTMNLNTIILIVVFIIVVMNVLIDGMDLSEPPLPDTIFSG